MWGSREQFIQLGNSDQCSSQPGDLVPLCKLLMFTDIVKIIYRVSKQKTTHYFHIQFRSKLISKIQQFAYVQPIARTWLQ